MDVSSVLNVTSPVTGGSCSFVRHFPTDSVIELYRIKHDIDVSSYFEGIETLEVLRCDTTGYDFFYPFSSQGDPDFYSDLYSKKSSEAWAYAGVRWEFNWVCDRLTNCGSILDIGCGSGEFLKRVAGKAPTVRGLETSSFGFSEAKKAGLDVRQETIQEHAKSTQASYDIVTAFQVLEHIHDVGDFLRSMASVVAPNGMLVIAVPNNGGFVGLQDDLPLNFPPHHMGLWRAESLAALAPTLGLQMITLEYEPLQEDVLDWYQSWVEQRYLPPARIAKSLYYRLGGAAILKRYLSENRTSIHGHTVLAAFRRT